MTVVKRLAAVLCIIALITGCGSGASEDGSSAQSGTQTAETTENTGSDEAVQTADMSGFTPVGLDKCDLGNPVTRDTGGDPSALVIGDKVYLYSGHDVSTDEEVSKAIYNIPEYVCYSSEDMINWQSEGVVMTMDTVKWADDTSAWASQVAEYKGKYYLYFCSWDKSGKQSIGVAVSDVPQGPFVDIGEPLVRGAVTKPQTSSFNDIDPTVWIETDEEGVEHRYLAWGNGIYFICELNEDMVSVTDQNGDGKITSGLDITEGDIVKRTAGLKEYTEAPWLYRRCDDSGNYTGPYYLFFAHQWRESIAYATTDDLMSGEWSDTKRIMFPTATSNTNHPAIIDFKGKTYFIGHNGALRGGSGFRRSVTIQELVFNEDGSIDLMEETAAGLSGETVKITTGDGAAVSHEPFVNSVADADYPYSDMKIGMDIGQTDTDALWIIRPGRSDPDDENLVSVESENKPGLYITEGGSNTAVLAQDMQGTDEMGSKQTFKTYAVDEAGSQVIFESVSAPGTFLVAAGGELKLGTVDEAKANPFIIN